MQQQLILLVALVVISVLSMLIALFMKKSNLEHPMSHMSHMTTGHLDDHEAREYKKMTFSDYAQMHPEMKKHDKIEYNTATDPSVDPVSELNTRVSKVETKLLELASLGGINREQLKFVTANLNKTVV